MADAADDASGASEADLGLTPSSEERYGEAAEHFERALKLDPDNPEWADLLAKAPANATAEVDVYVPELRFFDADALLAPPPEPRPAEPAEPARRSALAALRYLVGHARGEHRRRGVRDRSPTWSGGATAAAVWTNWYRKRLYRGILTLAYMREMLDRHNLQVDLPARTPTSGSRRRA